MQDAAHGSPSSLPWIPCDTSEFFITALPEATSHQLELAYVKKSIGASLVAQMVKNLPAMWETWVQSLVWEDPQDKEMATHSSILA